MSLFDFFRKKSRKSAAEEPETAGNSMPSIQEAPEPGKQVPKQHGMPEQHEAPEPEQPEVPEPQPTDPGDSTDQSLSISMSLSKDSVMELSGMPDEPDRGIRNEEDSISGERILKGDTLLGTYEVISDAIKGGMGSVWKVHHNGWNADLAMKRPQPRFFAEGSERRKKEFIAEAENWINLGLHPNIVSCYYVREIGGIPSIFSEWMDGGSLKDRIRDGSLYQGTEEEVRRRLLDVAIQTARGLRYAHQCRDGLIHQDVKPGNVLLSKDWDAKVADFGLARAQAHLSESDAAPSTGYTLAYCPKEQAAGAPAEPWMDVYAWALTVLEMYAGERFWSIGADAFPQAINLWGSLSTPVDKLPQRWSHLLPQKLFDAFKDDFYAGPGNWKSFLDYEHLLKEIYSADTGKAYPRPEPDAAPDNAASLNNRAISFLDLGKEKEAARMLEKSAAARHFDGTLNLALYRWRTGKIGGKEMLAAVEDLGKIYPSRSSELEETREQICLEACGQPQLPVLRMVIPPGNSNVVSGTAVVHDGELIATARRRRDDGKFYNYVCYFDPETGRMSRQFPTEGQKPQIRFTVWEGGTKLSPDGTKLAVSSSVKETKGVFDVIRQQKIDEDPFLSWHGKWVIRNTDALSFWDKNGDIQAKYRDDVPVFGQKGDGDRIFELLDGETKAVCVRIAGKELTWLSGSEFLAVTRNDEIRLYDVKAGTEAVLFRREKRERKNVLITPSGEVIQIPRGGRITSPLEYAPGCFAVGVYGRFYTLPELRKLPVYGWRERTGSEAPRIVRTDAKEMVVREALTDRNLASIAIPDFPGPRTTAIPDPENRRVLIYCPGHELRWAVVDFDFFPSELKQMKYRVSTPVSSEEALEIQNEEQRRMTEFEAAASAGDLDAMLSLYHEAADDESTSYQVLHKMNTVLAKRCSKKDLLKVIDASAGKFVRRKIPKALAKLSYISAVAPDGKCYAEYTEKRICRYDYPSGRAAGELDVDRLSGYGNDGSLHSLCMNSRGEVYAAYQCGRYTGRFEDKNYRVACLGQNLERDDTVLEIPGVGKSYNTSLIGVTEDDRFLVLYHYRDLAKEAGIDLVDLQSNKVIRSCEVSDLVKDVYDSFLSDQALTMMKGKKTTLELLWDYEPTSPGGTQAGAPAGEKTKTVALKGMRINGTVLEEYLGEENISAVVVPDHIETIGPGAFRGCELIRSVTIPENVRRIGRDAFRGCLRLEKVVIKSRCLEQIGEYAFFGCTSLREVQLAPCPLDVLEAAVFSGCKNLESLILPENLREIREEAFKGSGLTECVLPSGVQKIGRNAFAFTPLVRVDLPEGLSVLEKGCFRKTWLKEIVIPVSVEALPEDAFADCRYLEQIRNGGSIKQIGPGAFSECEKLKTVEVARGAVVHPNIFSDGIWIKKDVKGKERIIDQAVVIQGRTWDVVKHKAVPMCKVQFVPV